MAEGSGDRPQRLVDTASPYANTRSGVRYVGDSACTRCHAEIAETYRRHPMGRSLAPIAAAPATGADEADGRALFEAQGLEYSIEQRDGHVIHQETRRDASGRIVARNEAEVQFAVGSGRQGVAYLIERDGFLFQSPITWYAQKQRWDLSPGYEKANLHFDRPVQPDCLFCHANRVEPVAGTVNRYRPPIFRGHAIGCERCHGPGELHVAASRQSVDGRDMTIVNPAELEPSLRDAVCEQCHLIGHRRVVRLDRRDEDFRPGLPFHQFWSVLEPPAGPAENRVRRPGRADAREPLLPRQRGPARLHLLPRSASAPGTRGEGEPTTGIAAWSATPIGAAACRRRSGWSEAATTIASAATCRARAAPTSSMPPRRIIASPATPDAGDDRSPIAAGDAARPAAPSLVNFHRDLMDERERAEAERDIGVALCRDGPRGRGVALPLLEAALAARPDDVAAWEAKGFALGQLGRGEEALAAFRTALAREPDRESALAGAAYLAAREDGATTPSPTGGAPSPSAPGVRTTTPSWPPSSSRVATGGRPPRPAGRPSASTPPTSRPGSCSSGAISGSRIPRPPAANSRPSWDSILPDRDELLRWFAPLSRSP